MASTVNTLANSYIFHHEEFFNKKNSKNTFSTAVSPMKRNLVNKKSHKQLNSYALPKYDFDNKNNSNNVLHSLVYSQSMTNIGPKMKNTYILNESDYTINKNKNNKKLIKVNVKLGLSVSPKVCNNTVKKYKKYDFFENDINKIIKIQKFWKKFCSKNKKINPINKNNINNNKNNNNNDTNKKKKSNNILYNTDKKSKDKKFPIKLRSSIKGTNNTISKKIKIAENSPKLHNQNLPKKNLVNFNLNRPPSLLSLHPATININSNNEITPFCPTKNLSHRKKQTQSSVFGINKNCVLKNNENIIMTTTNTNTNTKSSSKINIKKQKCQVLKTTKKSPDSSKLNKKKLINSSSEKNNKILTNDIKNNIKTERKSQNYTNNPEYYKTEMSYQIINTIYNSKDKNPDCKIYENCLFNKNLLNTSLKSNNNSKYSVDKQSVKLNLTTKFSKKDTSPKNNKKCINEYNSKIKTLNLNSLNNNILKTKINIKDENNLPLNIDTNKNNINILLLSKKIFIYWNQLTNKKIIMQKLIKTSKNYIIKNIIYKIIFKRIHKIINLLVLQKYFKKYKYIIDNKTILTQIKFYHNSKISTTEQSTNSKNYRNTRVVNNININNYINCEKVNKISSKKVENNSFILSKIIVLSNKDNNGNKNRNNKDNLFPLTERNKSQINNTIFRNGRNEKLELLSKKGDLIDQINQLRMVFNLIEHHRKQSCKDSINFYFKKWLFNTLIHNKKNNKNNFHSFAYNNSNNIVIDKINPINKYTPVRGIKNFRSKSNNPIKKLINLNNSSSVNNINCSNNKLMMGGIVYHKKKITSPPSHINHHMKNVTNNISNINNIYNNICCINNNNNFNNNYNSPVHYSLLNFEIPNQSSFNEYALNNNSFNGYDLNNSLNIFQLENLNLNYDFRNKFYNSNTYNTNTYIPISISPKREYGYQKISKIEEQEINFSFYKRKRTKKNNTVTQRNLDDIIICRIEEGTEELENKKLLKEKMRKIKNEDDNLSKSYRSLSNRAKRVVLNEYEYLCKNNEKSKKLNNSCGYLMIKK